MSGNYAGMLIMAQHTYLSLVPLTSNNHRKEKLTERISTAQKNSFSIV
jgi:hypothetical protein